MSYSIHIGIEVHCELSTQTKLFSPGQNKSLACPNTCVHPIDMGFPGCLPVLNEKALEMGILACDALHCTIDPYVVFDRKNYLYPDLPKGFQITQYRHPLGRNGMIRLAHEEVRIQELHLEEDTAKLIHMDQKTLIDYNRCGAPLIEIVTDAGISSVDTACEYVRSLMNTLVYAGITKGRMEKGEFRVDINLSLSSHQNVLGTKVELKNLNSLSHMRKALEFEIKRQSSLLDQGKNIECETRRYDQQKKQTILLRKKESALDYRYMPEPNLPPVYLTAQKIRQIISRQKELPDRIYHRMVEEHGIDKEQALCLIDQKVLTDYYLNMVPWTRRYQEAVRILNTDVRAYLHRHPENKMVLSPKDFAAYLNRLDENVPLATIRQWIQKRLQGETVDDTYHSLSMDQMEQIVDEVLQKQAQSVKDYRNGKDRALGFMVGQVLKQTKGQADPSIVRELILKRLRA